MRHNFDYIISFENLLLSWREFLSGKRKRKDVAKFSLNLTDNILNLRRDLVEKSYCHCGYKSFRISDPKPREIHKASVRDRLVHHAVCRILFPFFDQKFSYNSFSCRKGKGTHRAMNRFRNFALKASCNNTRTCWVLKCDIKKFFANIDHKILIEIIGRHIKDADIIWLLAGIINSFDSKGKIGIGLPLGNLTSQLLVNVYMNEFDQFVMQKLKVKYYVRYADDFVILSENKQKLESFLLEISYFLSSKLKLELNPKKVEIKTLASGVDFLGWVHFSDHRILRKATRRRIFKKISDENQQSYFGLLRHGNASKIKSKLLDYSFQGQWFDTGTHEAYEQAIREWKSEK